MAKRIRVGLVGCGRRGIYVASLFKSHPDCEVTAVMDRFGACAAAAGNDLGVPKDAWYTDFGVMLKKAKVDALFFGCDPMVQVDLGCRAMEAGRHVCTEVPAAFSLDECRRLVDTVKKTGMKYQLLEQTRYWGFVDSWRLMRERGELGHVCLAQGEYVHYEKNWSYWTDTETGEIIREPVPPKGRKVEPHWRYKVLGDPIYYLPHTMSPLLKILDDKVTCVSCLGTRKHSYTYEDVDLPWTDIQYALMHTAKDTVMLVGAGFSLPHVNRGQLSAHWYELRGSKGSVVSPRYKEDQFRVWHPGSPSYEAQSLSPTPLDATEEQAKTGHGGADFKPVDTFIRSILDDTTPPMDVYRTVEMTAPAVVAAESARQGGAMLQVPEIR